VYDIVGHSLSGAIAAYWVAEEQDPNLLAAIHSIMTFDSPVQGLAGLTRDDVLRFIASGGTAGSNLTLDPVVQRMGRSAQVVDIFTFGNTNDRLVPSNRAVFVPCLWGLCELDVPITIGPDPRSASERCLSRCAGAVAPR
jgi:hypothetical protein